MEKSNSRAASQTAWVAKTLLVLCVIVAHTNFNSLVDGVLFAFLKRFGSMGVPAFLMLSGYYYRPQKYKSVVSWLQSKKYLFFPWMILGSLCYFWSFFRMGKPFSATSWLSFVLGKGSFLYYMTVLFLLQLMFYYLQHCHRLSLMISSVVISFISLELAAFGITDQLLSVLRMTNYLNFLNWIGFFAIGFWVQTVSEEQIIAFIRRWRIPAAVLWGILFLVLIIMWPNQYGYFSHLAMCMELLSSVMIIGIAFLLHNVEWLQKLGRYSFSVYLVHINIVPVTEKILSGSMAGILISPVISYVFTFALIWCSSFILKKTHGKMLVPYLLGLKLS